MLLILTIILVFRRVDDFKTHMHVTSILFLYTLTAKVSTKRQVATESLFRVKAGELAKASRQHNMQLMRKCQGGNKQKALAEHKA